MSTNIEKQSNISAKLHLFPTIMTCRSPIDIHNKRAFSREREKREKEICK